jgi:hypothetical protein
MRDIVCLSEPSSPADFSPRRPNIKPFRSLQDFPRVHVQGRDSKVISALKGKNNVSTVNERFSASRLPRGVIFAKAASDSSIRINNNIPRSTPRNRALSYAATPLHTHPLAVKHSREDSGTDLKAAMKGRSNSQSTPSQTRTPKHQLTPIPQLSSAAHEMKFVFPDVPNPNLNQPDNSMQPEKGVAIAAVAAVAPPKRKMSSMSMEMDPIVEEEDGEVSPISGPLPVAANSKLESSHPSTYHANMDHPSPIRYMQTDI